MCKPDSTIAAATPGDSLPLVPRSVQCRVRDKLFKMPLPPTYEVLQELGKEFIDRIVSRELTLKRKHVHKQLVHIGMKSILQAYCIKLTLTQATCACWHEEHFAGLLHQTLVLK